ncbi:MAG TPA: hypothetical protein VM716_02070 [Gemmatimonadales bacterium]|nr:hypothetical protein [Gemmatimonadales bacterium]
MLIASEPLPEQRVLSFFTETERFLLKPLSLDELWREIQDVGSAARPAPSRQPAEAPGAIPRSPG